MKTKLCLPIVVDSQKKVLHMIKIHIQSYDLFELWIDYLGDYTINFILQLQKLLGNKLIITFRRKRGESIVMNTEERFALLQSLHTSSVYVDLDIQQQGKDLEFVKKNNLNLTLITSFHNYEKTPKISDLIKIKRRMEIYYPEIYKIATFCQSEKSAVSLMHFLVDVKEEHEKVIVLGMGEYGKITRIFGALYGNDITFAPEKLGDESAPGQITKNDFETMYAILNSKI